MVRHIRTVQRSAGRWACLTVCVMAMLASASWGLSGFVSAQSSSVRLNRAIEKLQQGESIIGALNGDFSLSRARVLATSDLDFVILEMEHNPLDFERLRTFLLGMTDKAAILRNGNLQLSVPPLVRIPQYGRENLQFIVKQVLDLGVFGIMFPAIETREQALNAVRASRYPQSRGAPDAEPIGQRGSGSSNAAWFWGLSTGYAQRADTWPVDPQGELLLLLQIETIEGVRNVDDILSVPGIGVIFIGPSDLSYSLGVPSGSPEHEAAIQTVLAACLASNVPCAITTNANTVESRLREGFRVVTVGGGGLEAGADAALKIGREALQR